MTMKLTTTRGELFEGTPEEIFWLYQRLDLKQLPATLPTSTSTEKKKMKRNGSEEKHAGRKPLGLSNAEKLAEIIKIATEKKIPLFLTSNPYIARLHLKFIDDHSPLCGNSKAEGRIVKEPNGAKDGCGICILASRTIDGAERERIIASAARADKDQWS